MRLSLWVPMVPVAKARARVRRDGHTYTPAATAAAEELIRVAWMAQHGARYRYLWRREEPLRLSVTLWVARPASVTRPLPSVRPDLDNFLKLAQDSLNGAAYRDDSQITSYGDCGKRYADDGQRPGLEITLEDDPAAGIVALLRGDVRLSPVRSTRHGNETLNAPPVG